MFILVSLHHTVKTNSPLPVCFKLKALWHNSGQTLFFVKRFLECDVGDFNSSHPSLEMRLLPPCVICTLLQNKICLRDVGQ